MTESRRFVALVSAVVLSATITSVGFAEGDAPVIWYRSSDGCPDGASFLARLRGRAAGARLAQVSDRIDFVVTLGTTGGRSSGKLERQTVGSTVAIREFETQSCEEVADVLALTLTLTVSPESTTEAAPSGPNPPPPAEPAPSPSAEPATQPSVSRPTGKAPPTPVDAPRSDAVGADDHAGRAVWLLGGQLGVVSGPTGALGPRVSFFIEVEPGFGALPSASARLSAFVSRVEDRFTEVAFTTFGGKLDGCPVDLTGPTLHVRPCLGIELGSALAQGLSESGRVDSGAWAAAFASGRMSWLVTPKLALELEGGAYLPLIRYSLQSEAGSEIHQADKIGFFAAAGAAYRVP